MKLSKLKTRQLMVFLGLGVAGLSYSAEIDVVATQLENTSAASVAAGVPLLNGSQTWTADNVYILTDRVYVKAGDTLTIEPGTRIFSSTEDNGPGKGDDSVGSIVITKGASINAVGTPESPIVMSALEAYEVEIGMDTSYDTDIVMGIANAAPTQCDGGLWGGLIILGDATIYTADANGDNVSANVIEGFAGNAGNDNGGVTGPDILEYGGSNDTHNGGTVQYVSIRHGGYEFDTGKEINGLTLGGVGSGTTIDHVEVFANSDDGIEFFGGTVSTSHMVMAFNQDDSYDVDEGHQARHDYWFAIQTGNDGAGGSLHDNGAELDGASGSSSGRLLGLANGNIVGSKPVIYNATFIGAGTGALDGNDKGGNAMLMEDGFDGEFYDSVFDDFPEALLELKDGADSTPANGTPAADFNTIGRFGDYVSSNNDVIDGDNSVAELFFDPLLGTPIGDNSDANTDPQFCNVTRDSNNKIVSLDPRPVRGSPLLTSTTSGNGAAYRGAFDSSDLWAAGWTALTEYGLMTGGALTSLLTDDVDVVATLLENTSAASVAAGVPLLNGSQTWTSDKTYILTDRVYVKAGDTLTIEPGTRIFSTTADNGPGKGDDAVGSIVITKGASINAAGTAESPIIMSALQALEAERNADMNKDGDIGIVEGGAPTQCDGGLWGGLIILGDATIYTADANGDNVAANVIEGFAGNAGNDNGGVTGPDILEYGGSNDTHNGGTVQYVSIRHGGYEFATGKEINGLTLGGVGSGTTIDHVEVFANSDDGIEFFGGTVSTSHMVMAFNQDDSYDVDEGHQARHDYWFAIQTGNDGAGGSLHDNGAELDGASGSSSGRLLGLANGNIVGSKPVIYNATFIGAGTGALDGNDKGSNAMLMEDGFDSEFYDSVFDDFPEALLELKDGADSTPANGTPAADFNTIGRFGDYVSSNNDVIDGDNSVAELFFDPLLGTPIGDNSDANTDPLFGEVTRDANKQNRVSGPLPASRKSSLDLDNEWQRGGLPRSV